MTIERRGFLKALAAFAVAAAATPLKALERLAPPTLWGDGIHDDTAAIQWRIDHEGFVNLKEGTYRVTSPLSLGTDQAIYNGRLDCAGDASHALRLHGERIKIMNVHIDRASQSVDYGIYSGPAMPEGKSAHIWVEQHA